MKEHFLFADKLSKFKFQFGKLTCLVIESFDAFGKCVNACANCHWE